MKKKKTLFHPLYPSTHIQIPENWCTVEAPMYLQTAETGMTPPFHLLAQNDSILQALLEVGSNGVTSHIFNPAPQLFFL